MSVPELLRLLLQMGLSGLVGVIENMLFFEVIFPTLYATFRFKQINKMTAAILSMSITAAIFMLFHIFVYGYQQVALFSTLVFAFIVPFSNCSSKYRYIY